MYDMFVCFWAYFRFFSLGFYVLLYILLCDAAAAFVA